MDRIDNTSLDLEKQNIEKIKELFPAAVEEGKINFDMLRTMLGDEVDDSKEKYQFTWNGKSKAIKSAQTPSSTTLRPCIEKSKNWDTTENLYIEGDNLEVLKQLQKTYYGKVKMIYIDPPYNTGKDFIYHDDYKNSIENYKEQTNQTKSSNPESNGRFHTDWLNMMYPRLLLAKNLLKEDGAIYISIDDNELENLKKICNEIFGENNFVANIVWKHTQQSKNDELYFSRQYNHTLLYAKNKSFLQRFYFERTEEDNKNYSNPDNDPKGLWRSGDVRSPNYRKTLCFDLLAPNGNIIKAPANGWRWSEDSIKEKIACGEIKFKDDNTGIIRKIYLCDQPGRTPENLWEGNRFGSTRQAAAMIKDLFDGIQVFDTPKPVELIYNMLIILTKDPSSIILDFFAGSSTTAHAVMKLNAEDGGNRKYIMVQLPELCDDKSEAYKAGYNNICEIGEERIRRAGAQIKSEWEKVHPSDSLFAEDEKFTTDIGFKVFKLDSSNVNEWDSSLELEEKELAERLGEVFKKDRNKEDILYEIMLKYGVFDKPVDKVTVNGKAMYRVGKRYMIVCLENDVTAEDVKAIAELSPKTVVFKEEGFNDDNAKINAIYNLEKAGVEDVKCI